MVNNHKYFRIKHSLKASEVFSMGYIAKCFQLRLASGYWKTEDEHIQMNN